ncbi:MAG: GTPase HflX [Treponema sp.]|jgi:GTP-binding protein HflX|nr:GTPase HflX [Treponema sp.]
MKEPINNEEMPPKVFLAGIRESRNSKNESESLLRELDSLAQSLGLEVIAKEIVNIREKHAQYGMGTGKAAEIAEKAKSVGAECLIFDREISPSQQRNWEELSGLSVMDRQELIIQIFSSKAKTREAALQTELAELVYSLPRLQHKYIDLNRQRGGRYGTRGSGETRLETDRRNVEKRIQRLEEELEEVRQQRETQRKQRRKQQVPVAALVGYTNAGKSSILNVLTDAGVLAEDKLFATLDSTSRRLELPGGLPVLLTDTVGFIRRLPHSLVKAFQSTLEEASLSDLIINVVDASEPDWESQYKTTLSVLADLGAAEIPRIDVFNKIDKTEIPVEARESKMNKNNETPTIAVSAVTGVGLPELLACMESMLSGEVRRYSFPQTRTDLAALLHRSGTVISEKYLDETIEMEARVDAKTAGQLKEFALT